MIQDIAPHIFRNEYKPVPPEKRDILLCYDGRNILLKQEDEKISYPVFEELEAMNAKEDLYENYIYLFSIDEKRFYLGSHLNTEGLEGYSWENTSQTLRVTEPKCMGFAGVTGWQLYNWYNSRKFCGRCGKPMVHDGKERMMRCPECGLMEFPKICPAVIVGVTHGNRILMSKYAGREYTKYALLAGFTEIGETPEETVKREVFEEVGVRVKNITYYKSQPWSFSDTLLMGFYCDLDGEDEHVVLDKEELAFAEWFERGDIPVKPEDCSLTNEMIMTFKEKGRKVYEK